MSTKEFWNGLGHWLRAIDDAVFDDPNEALTRRIEQLETRLAEVECPKQGSST